MSIHDRMVEALARELAAMDNRDWESLRPTAVSFNEEVHPQSTYLRRASALLTVKIDGRYSLVVYDDEWGQPLRETEADQDVPPYHPDWSDEDGHH